MSYPCADNSGFMFYHGASTSHPDAPLVAIAQQLLQKQQQYQQKQLPENSLQVLRAGGRPNSRHDPPQPISRFCCSDALEEFSSSTASCIMEPTSVLDLCSPSLDSMHSPLNLSEQRLQEMDQCLHESYAMDRLLPDSFASELATASSKRTLDCSILEENDEFFGEIEELGASPERELKDGDGSSEWMDFLLSDAEEVGIASCFEKNLCESTQSSEVSCYPCSPEQRWGEDFSFACSSWALRACSPGQLASSLALPQQQQQQQHQHQLTSSSNLASSLVLPQQQPHQQQYGHGQQHQQLQQQQQQQLQRQQQQQQQQQPTTQRPSHLLGIPRLYAPAAHQFGTRLDAYGVLTSAGLLGVHLQRKAGERGLRLLQLLLDCVANLEATESQGSSLDCADIMKKLRELSSACGDPLQRVAFYFTEAITARLEVDPSSPAAAPAASVTQTGEGENTQETMLAFRTLNEASPYIKFAHLTANQAILEATETAERVHIIDCGIAEGVQWASLLQAFASRPPAAAAAPLRIKITGIASPIVGADPSSSLAATGKRLSEFATFLNLEFEFCAVCINQLEDLHPSMLRLDDREVVAVNFMFQLHHLLDDSMQHLRRVLQLVQLLRPAVITVAEYEASINVAPLQVRFLNAFCFYAAVFDSLEAAMAREDPERARVEKLFFAREINTLMAVGGTATRKERRESGENWRRLMETSGYWSAPFSHFATCQAHLLLWLYCEDFSLIEGAGCLSLCWLKHPILTVSSWHC